MFIRQVMKKLGFCVGYVGGVIAFLVFAQLVEATIEGKH